MTVRYLLLFSLNKYSHFPEVQSLSVISRVAMQSGNPHIWLIWSSGTLHACRTLRSASVNLLSVTRCNISFRARGFRSAAPAIWNSLPSNVRSCETLTTFRRHLKSHCFH